MQNQTINLKNLCSSIGLFSLFLIFCGYELKAESISPSERKYLSSSKIKWVRYDDSIEDKEIETVNKDFEEPKNQLITKDKKEEIVEDNRLVGIFKMNDTSYNCNLFLIIYVMPFRLKKITN